MALAITTSGHHPQSVVRVPVSSGKPAYLRDAMDVTKKMQILDAARFASKYGNIGFNSNRGDGDGVEYTVTALLRYCQHTFNYDMGPERGGIGNIVRLSPFIIFTQS
jgi:hypothetical protein